MAEESQRRSAHEIFETVVSSARDELDRNSLGLGFSGLAAGFSMGLTALGVALAHAHLGEGPRQDMIAKLFYPLGFVVVIIGRKQLFTENTLFPVALVLREGSHLLNTLRLWIVVFLTNIFGAALFAAAITKLGALEPHYEDALVRLGTGAAQGDFAHIFASGIFGGWLIALVAWVVSASHWTISQIVSIYLITYVMGLAEFAHCIAGSAEILAAVFAGSVGFGYFSYWLTAATLGNIVGGVFLVAVLNYGQVQGSES